LNQVDSTLAGQFCHSPKGHLMNNVPAENPNLGSNSVSPGDTLVSVAAAAPAAKSTAGGLLLKPILAIALGVLSYQLVQNYDTVEKSFAALSGQSVTPSTRSDGEGCCSMKASMMAMQSGGTCPHAAQASMASSSGEGCPHAAMASSGCCSSGKGMTGEVGAVVASLDDDTAASAIVPVNLLAPAIVTE
jgi:hypothetical protein